MAIRFVARMERSDIRGQFPRVSLRFNAGYELGG